LLPPATEKVWNFLQEQPALAGFVLVGGSALALTIRHRVSEDLDLVFPDIRLPRQRLNALFRGSNANQLEIETAADAVVRQAKKKQSNPG
jgi:hypothetical protein